MKYLVILFLFTCMVKQACFAQYFPLNEEKYRDSLSTIFRSGNTNDIRARTGFLLSYYWKDKDSAKAMQYLQQSVALSKGNTYLTTVADYYRGTLLNDDNKDAAASLFLKTAAELKKFDRAESYLYQAKCQVGYAIIQKEKNAHKVYTDIILNKAIPLTLKAGDSVYLGILYLDIGIGFKNMMDFASAEKNLQLSLEILRAVKAPPEYFVPVYHTIAENAALSGKNDLAGQYLDSMKMLLKPFPESYSMLDYYAGAGMHLTVEEKFTDALTVINKGIALAKKLKAAYPEQRLLMQKFYALYNRKNYKEAKDLMLDLMQRKEIMSLAVNRVQLYYGLALTYENMNNKSDAYDWMKKYSALNDSIIQNNTLKNMRELEAKYQSSENEKKILSLQSEKADATLQSQQQKSTNRLLIIVCLFLLIIIIFAIFYYRKSTMQKEVNHRQQLKEIEHQQQLKLTQAMLEGEDRERARMAQDLHDGLGGMLAGVKINLSGWTNNHPDISDDNELHKVIYQLDNSVSELRRIARNMMPVTLLRFGLTKALEELCDFYRHNDLKIAFQYYNIDKHLPLSVQVNIYRIIQELLSNAVKHSGANNIILQCSFNENIFFITIEDNGQGFDTQKVNQQKGMGLSNIENRINYLKGKFDINSSAEGTVINIELSTNEQQK